MYKIYHNDLLLQVCASKGEVNSFLHKLAEQNSTITYSIVQDVTDEFPSLDEHRASINRLSTIDWLGDQIDFSWTATGYDNQSKRERWDRLMKEQNEWEYRCGY